jgi:hypothetical protein
MRNGLNNYLKMNMNLINETETKINKVEFNFTGNENVSKSDKIHQQNMFIWNQLIKANKEKQQSYHTMNLSAIRERSNSRKKINNSIEISDDIEIKMNSNSTNSNIRISIQKRPQSNVIKKTKNINSLIPKSNSRKNLKENEIILHNKKKIILPPHIPKVRPILTNGISEENENNLKLIIDHVRNNLQEDQMNRKIISKNEECKDNAKERKLKMTKSKLLEFTFQTNISTLCETEENNNLKLRCENKKGSLKGKLKLNENKNLKFSTNYKTKKLMTQNNKCNFNKDLMELVNNPDNIIPNNESIVEKPYSIEDTTEMNVVFTNPIIRLKTDENKNEPFKNLIPRPTFSSKMNKNFRNEIENKPIDYCSLIQNNINIDYSVIDILQGSRIRIDKKYSQNNSLNTSSNLKKNIEVQNHYRKSINKKMFGKDKN